MRPLLCSFVLLVLTASMAGTVSAARVTHLTAIHHDGQTFLTWTTPPGLGWTYRVYASDQPIYQLADFWNAHLTAMVKDSSWVDRRLYGITGIPFGYSVDSLATPLDSTQALAVLTPASDGSRWYAVTADSSGYTEDRSFLINDNTLLAAVPETVAPPRPVYQRTLTSPGCPVEIYTLWTSDQATPYFPVMANRPSMAYDCGVARTDDTPGVLHSLMIRPHARGGNFLQPACWTTGHPNEWRLMLDDPWMADGNSFWYGYHENYSADSPWYTPPSSGMVRDYTMQRILYTLGWMRRSFPIDTTRVYASGYSMGGIGSVLLAFNKPEWIAAVESVVGKFDFAFETDPNPESQFNTGMYLRQRVDNMWGTVSADLPTSEGVPVYARLNDSWMAARMEGVGIPPIIAFNGKNDITVGWAEKIPFYASMEHYRHGGYFFWDTRDHMGSLTSMWWPLQNELYLYRFRTDLSYPAIDHCSADMYAGGGAPSSGDSVGTINGFVEWDTCVVDQPDRWEVSLHLRDLHGQFRDYAAPESAQFDLTPRRLQSFRVLPYHLYRWSNTRSSDGRVVQGYIEQADSLGLLTLRFVKGYRGTSNLIHIEEVQEVTGVGPGAVLPSRPSIAFARNPMVAATAVRVAWPGTGEAELTLMDVGGRMVKTLWRGRPAGPTSLRLDAAALANGVYFMKARQGASASAARMVVLH